jgi:hypothetical protein
VADLHYKTFAKQRNFFYLRVSRQALLLVVLRITLMLNRGKLTSLFRIQALFNSPQCMKRPLATMVNDGSTGTNHGKMARHNADGAEAWSVPLTYNSTEDMRIPYSGGPRISPDAKLFILITFGASLLPKMLQHDSVCD